MPLTQREEILTFLKGQSAFVSTQTISKKLGLGASSVSPALNRLLAEGLVEQIDQWGPNGGYGWRLSKAAWEQSLTDNPQWKAVRRERGIVSPPPPTRFERDPLD